MKLTLKSVCLLVLSLVSLVGCATTTTSSEQVSSNDNRQIVINHNGKTYHKMEDLDTVNYPVLYQIAGVASGVKQSAEMSAGTANMVFSTIDLSTGALGLGSILSKGLNVGVFIGGFLAPPSKDEVTQKMMRNRVKEFFQGRFVYGVKPLQENRPYDEQVVETVRSNIDRFDVLAKNSCKTTRSEKFDIQIFSNLSAGARETKSCIYLQFREIQAESILKQLNGQAKRYAAFYVPRPYKDKEETMQALRDFAGQDGSVIYLSDDHKSVIVERQGKQQQFPLPPYPFKS